MPNTSEMLDLFMIGDKLATIAQKLRVLPRSMATSQIPLIDQMFPGIDNLECTRCIMTSKRQVLYSAAKRINVFRVSLEKDSPESLYWAGLSPADMEDELKEEGFKTDIVDFSKGLHHGVMEAGRVYNKEKEAKRLIKSYDIKLAEAEDGMPDCSGIRVVILLGMINPYDGAHYLLVEGKDSYMEKTITRDLKFENKGDVLVKKDAMTINDLSPLKEVCPDAIAITGDSQVGLLAIFKAVKNDPDFLKIPAIKNHAIFSLPHCSGGNPIDYPFALQEWSKAFKKI